MKASFFIPILLLFVLNSCQSIRVASDYDKEAHFTSYKTYAFLKQGIDKVEINDLDKKRILKSIENALSVKGFSASENPNILINIATDSHKNISIHQDPFAYYGFGWGWSPFYGGITATEFKAQPKVFCTLMLLMLTQKVLFGKGKVWVI